MARNTLPRITDRAKPMATPTPIIDAVDRYIAGGDTPEQMAYYAANFARHQAGETPYDGIDAWRAAVNAA